VVIVVVGLVIVLVGALLVRRVVDDDEPPVVVVHWSNSHPMREELLPAMAEQFNADDHETPAGRPIEVVVVSCDSAVQTADLLGRVGGTGPVEQSCRDGDEPASDPTVVTPQSADWLVGLNHDAGRDVVDLAATQTIAETWLGIVTYRAMAECLGWPDRELGYGDILALSADPEGWAAYDCARTEWGRQPLLAFTNPSTSTSGRNVLVSLYAIAAGKDPAALTVADVERPEVVQYVRDFQQLVDHYLPTTLLLNTKIDQGSRYGHFFLMPEDNLVSLAEGNEQAIGRDGTRQPIPPRDDLVMIYPKEGSVLNSNPAAIIDAPWVTAEHADAAASWISYLRQDAQQQRFMDAGFRPANGTALSVDPQQFAGWGLDASEPHTTIEPGTLEPEVLAKIIESWGSVKNPAIVTFVVDTSGSMEGEPLAKVKDGLVRLVDAMSTTASQGTANEIGLITFSSEVDAEIAPSSVREARFTIGDAIASMEASGNTALFDAIDAAVTLTDQAAGDPRATRAVVVLSDGAATTGGCLDELIAMTTIDEDDVTAFCAQEGDVPQTAAGPVAVEEVRGVSLQGEHEHDIQVFFLGFGEADLQVGRLLAEATGAEYQGSPDDALAAVIEELSGYF
jgi:Ca-activated chloride channel family protein